MSQDIRTAIEQRRLLSFTYGGHPRTVMPAALGVAKRKRKPVLHAYQVEGGSSRGGIPAWRYFYADEMSDLRLLDETFAADPPGWAPGALEEVEVSLAGGARPASASEGSKPSLPSIPPEAQKVVEDVLGAVGRWFKKK